MSDPTDTTDAPSGRWMTAWPISTLGALLLALVLAGVFSAWHVRSWSARQRFYLPAFVTSAALIQADLGGWHYRYARFAAERARDSWTHRDFHDWLIAAVYGARVTDLFFGPLLASALVFGLLLPFAAVQDRARVRQRWRGRRVRGSELVESTRAFNRRLGAIGLSIPQRPFWRPALRLPPFLSLFIAGDARMGKTQTIAWFLDQKRARGERCIVYVPSGDFVVTHWRDGDTLLHIDDARSPGWSIGDEVTTDLHARTLAEALIPLELHTAKFWSESARDVLTALLKLKPTCQQLVIWLTDNDALAKVVNGPMQHTAAGRVEAKLVHRILDPVSPGQRQGVVGSLMRAAAILRLVPNLEECQGRWSAAAWAASDDPGWLFLTSTPATRDALIPLQTLWLDALILRLMERGQGQGQHTTLVLDEVATLRELTQLKTVMAEGEKYHVHTILGFQSFAQIAAVYDKHAETVLSQTGAQIILRTSGSLGPRWASTMLGDWTYDRLVPRRQGGPGVTHTTTRQMERHTDPLILPSDISGLDRLTGYVKVGGLVTPIRIRPKTRPTVAPALIQRSPKPPASRGLAPTLVFDFDPPPDPPGGTSVLVNLPRPHP